MKTSGSWNFRALAGKILLGLVLTAATLGSMDVAPAFAGDRDRHEGRHDNGRFDHRGRGHRGGYYDRGHVYRSYGYVEPVYVAPPVYYAPPPAPGVSIFLPTIHIR